MLFDLFLGFANMMLNAFFSVLSIPTYLFQGLQYFILWVTKYLVLFQDIIFLDVILRIGIAFLIVEGLLMMLHTIVVSLNLAKGKTFKA